MNQGHVRGGGGFAVMCTKYKPGIDETGRFTVGTTFTCVSGRIWLTLLSFWFCEAFDIQDLEVLCC